MLLLNLLCIPSKQCMAVRRWSGSCWRGKFLLVLEAEFFQQLSNSHSDAFADPAADVTTHQTTLTAAGSLRSWMPSGTDTYQWPGCLSRSTRYNWRFFLLLYIYINFIFVYFAALQAYPTAVDVLGTQPVHQVAVTGQEEALRYLVLDLRVDVNQRTADNRLTALHYAAKVTSQ